MTDVVDSRTRSKMMSGIRGKDTKIEIQIRRELHRLGFRYRLHDKQLAGKPDIVLKKYHAAIFVHGCFWHRHDCHLFKWPKTRTEFWKEKINHNHHRDLATFCALRTNGWRVCVVWECSIRGAKKSNPRITRRIARWLKSDDFSLEIAG